MTPPDTDPIAVVEGTLRALVFDMDGTLLDSLPVVLACYRRTVLAFADLSPEEILSTFQIGPATVMFETLIGRSVGPEAIAGYEARLTAEVHGVVVYEGIHDTLAALSTRLPLGVFTAADTSAAEILLRATGLRPLVDPVVGADMVGRPKPAPDGLLAVCNLLGIPPADVAYVGDGPADVEVARGSGALAVAAAWGHQWRDGRGADVTLRWPGDLLSLIAPAEPSGGTR